MRGGTKQRKYLLSVSMMHTAGETRFQLRLKHVYRPSVTLASRDMRNISSPAIWMSMVSKNVHSLF